jgi:tetratricopeptide (TPR) repeat protein
MNKKTTIGSLLFAVMLLSACSSGLLQRAETKYLARDYPAAAALFAEYLAEHPDAYQARRKLGHSLLKEGEPRQAASEFEKVVTAQPHDIFSHLYLGLAYLRLGDYQQALAIWQQAETSGRPLVAEEKARQIKQVAAAAPDIPSPGQFNDLANRVESGFDEAFFAEERREAYNAARLGDCG